MKLNINIERNLSFGNFKHFILHSTYNKDQFESEVHFKKFSGFCLFVCLFSHKCFREVGLVLKFSYYLDVGCI